MRFAVVAATALVAGFTTAAPAPASHHQQDGSGDDHKGQAGFSIPTDDGYPTPNPEQLRFITEQADGKLGNAPPPATINESSHALFQLVAHNENFEVAFFSSLHKNMTENVKGYGTDVIPQPKLDELLDLVETILAQEQLHHINAANTLRRFNALVPLPCQYQFPTSTIFEAVALAERFTDLVLGTLQDVAQSLARNGDVGAVRGVASSLGQEGQQSGFYRILLGKKPSEKPFLTTNLAAYAFSALNQFIVPGSCPFDLGAINLPTFPALAVLSGENGANVESKDQILKFRVDFGQVKDGDKYVGKTDGAGLWITMLSGQLLPISEPLRNVVWDGKVATFEAEFPYEENIMDGLTVAALTTRNDFKAVGEMVAATLAAPGLIQVDDRVKSWDGYKL